MKIRANLKRHNHVYILSSKHTYRPIRARIEAQLFYNQTLRHFSPLTDSLPLMASATLITRAVYLNYDQLHVLVCTTQVNSDPSTIHLQEAEGKQNGFCRCTVTNKVSLWAASYSACVIYTKTIIHLSVGESCEY